MNVKAAVSRLTNNSNMGLAMAVWLADETYSSGQDQFPDKDLISATTLLKPTRRLVLENRLPILEHQVDTTDLIQSKVGTAIHSAVEQVWQDEERRARAMRRLGQPERMIAATRVNPTEAELSQGGIFPVYLEQRFFREINNVVISGQYDLIIGGELNDIKKTSVYTWINRSKDEDYQLQGSIYRWINPEKITSDVMRIQHYFSDWQRSMSRTVKNYPAHPILEHHVELLSLAETEAIIVRKIDEILANQHLPEADLIRCSPDDLWMSPPKFKYYADSRTLAEGGRSTKNFDTFPEAAQHQSSKGKGVVVEVPSAPKACGYCPAFDICSQKNEYTHEE